MIGVGRADHEDDRRTSEVYIAPRTKPDARTSDQIGM